MTLSAEPGSYQRALSEMKADARLMLGEAVQSRIPVVIDSPSLEQSEALVRSLAETEGVVHVGVVAIDFSEDQ